MKALLAALLSLLLTPAAAGQTKPAVSVCGECIRKNMEVLASDEMRGRGSGTEDEHRAAEYIAGQLKAYGIQPAGDGAGFIQQVVTVRRTMTGKPVLKVPPTGAASAGPKIFTYGKDFLSLYLTVTQFSGPLQKVDSDKPEEHFQAGAVALITGSDEAKARNAAYAAFSSGAIAALLPSTAGDDHFVHGGDNLPKLPPRLEGSGGPELGGNFAMLELSPAALELLRAVSDGTPVQFAAEVSEEKAHTWNVVGSLRGSDPALQHAAVLFSAHLDHLGIGRPVKGDSIYNGADDDASGTAAVLEIARALGARSEPKRTVIFALFGSEETGGLGATYFREHPPMPLQDMAANLEFEMIGRPDPAVKADTVWLSGWERSNLGPTLAEHGAHLIGDPHPEQDFFARSDNYVLAKKGVVAQTISSYGLHKDYHRPSDDLSHIDFQHMTEAIGSLLAPVAWLVNSDFKPQWNKGGQP